MIKLTEILSEDLRAWFGKGGKGGVGGGGWDRYNSSGDRVGKCGDAKEGEAYSACLSKEKARKLGKAGRAAFVKRKRAAQAKGGDAKKGGERKKGQKPIKVKTGVKENISVESAYNKIDSLPQGKIFDDAKRIDNIFNKSKHSYSEVIEAYEKNKNNNTTQFVTVKDIHITQPNIQSNKVKQTITSSDVTAPLNVVQFPDGEMAIYDGHHRLTVAWAMGKNKIKVNLVKAGANENLDPDTYTDTGKSSPYGSGYQKVKELEERLSLFLEKNVPTDKSKWSYYKSQAKKKFDVYPSAYANAWAAKMYKKAGGGWRKS
jgi:hypothetical protein